MSSEHIKAECLRKATIILTTGRRGGKPPPAKELVAYAKELEKYISK